MRARFHILKLFEMVEIASIKGECRQNSAREPKNHAGLFLAKAVALTNDDFVG